MSKATFLEVYEVFYNHHSHDNVIIPGLPLWLSLGSMYIWMAIFFTQPHKVGKFCTHGLLLLSWCHFNFAIVVVTVRTANVND